MMIHHNFIDDIRKYSDIIQQPGMLDLFRKQQTINMAFCSLLIDEFVPVVKKDIPVFYIEGIEFPTELIMTAREFYKEGFLSAPFPECHFILRNCSIKSEGKEDSFNIPNNTISLIDKEDVSIVVTYAHAIRRDLTHPCGLTYLQKNSPHEISTWNAFAGVPGRRDTEEQVHNVALQDTLFLQLTLLMMGMPHIEKIKTEIPDKLQKARAKRRKPPLTPYITVQLNAQIRDYLERESHARGYKVKPHWRRGHVRTLHDGKKTPVQPCLVNWDGETEIQKKAYKVKA